MGLVGWWRAEGNGADVTGAHDGSFPYGIGYSGGKVGQGFDFDWSTRRLSIPDSPAFQLTNAMTLEGWVYIRQFGGFICFRGDNRPGLDTWTLDTYQSGLVNFQIGDENNNGSSVQAPLTLNQWHHVAGTWDRTSGDMKIYMDGALVTQTSTTVIPIGVLDPGSEPAIGIGNHGGTFHQFPLNGLVDEFAIYNRALTASEIQSIFNAGSAGKCLPPPPPPACAPAPAGLVGWWNGEGNANDKAGTNNGVLEGTLGFASGKVGQAFSFGSVNADVRVPASPALNVGSGSGFTVETWINPSDVSQLHPIVEWNDGAGSWGVHFYISIDAGPGSFYANITDSGGGWHQMHSSIAPLVTNSFQHVALTYDKAAGLATIYCNGLVVAQQNLGSFTPLTTYDVYFGRRPPGGADAYTFEGSIDEASIFNRALTASEIQSIYNAGSAGKCEPVVVPPPPLCSPPSAGMVSWWRAENNGSDAATNNSGIPASGLSFAPGKVGQAFSFDGANDHFDIPASVSLNVGSADGMTFETWVKPSTINMQVVAEWNNGAGGVGSHMWLSVDHTVAGDGVGNISVNLYDTTETSHDIHTPAGVMVANEWQHIAVTYDKPSGVGKIYRNGAQVAMHIVGTFTPQTSYDLHLGYRASSAFQGTYFGGLMDEPTLYNRALSPVEIQSIYNSASAGKCAPPPSSSLFIAGPITNAANGHAYYLLSPTNWPAAEAIAVSLGGHLATINNAAETLWVYNTFGSYGGGDYTMWIGCNDEVNEGEWHWTSGWGGTYSNWSPGQPDNYGGAEDHVWMWSPAHGQPPGSWNDGPGSFIEPAVIEIGEDAPIPVILAGPITNSANGHAYYLLSPTNWHAAEAIAVNLGGHLATINDVDENTWVYDTFASYGGDDYRLWIGYTDEANEGQWRWLNGWRGTYSNWYPGEPNNWENSEHYAWIWNPGSGAGGTWADAGAGLLEAAVVEIGIDPPLCTAPPSGLIGLWRSEGNANDSFALNNGFVVNGTSFTTGMVGQAFSFDGVNDSVTIPQTPQLNPGNQVTIEFWMKADPTNAMNSYQGLVTSDFFGIEIANGFALGPVGVSFFISTDSGASVSPASYPDTATDNGGGAIVSAGVWHHVAGTYDGTKLQLYIDGQPWGVPAYASGLISPMLPNSFVSIGGEDGRTICPDCIGSRYFNGLIDDVAIYRRVLSAAEIHDIYIAADGGKCSPPPLDQLIIAGPITNSANGHWYYLTTELPWHDAENVGLRLGGHLTTIDDDTENSWVEDTFGNWGGTGREMWIGLTDELVEGEWRWADGRSSTNRHWGPGQPDNYGGWEGAPGEDYAHFWIPDGSGLYLGTWNDAPGYLSHFGVIEISPTNEPSSIIIAGPITNAANGHAYYLLSQTNWPGAEQIALSLGGHLVTINDAAENQWVFDTFGNFGGENHDLWIGGTDQENEGIWRWISGSPRTYSNWNEGEPNNGGEGGPDEDYAWIWSPASNPSGTWNDAPGYLSRCAVVEVGIDSLPPGTACVTPATGLVAWWKSEGNANDFGGTNHGTLVGSAGFAPNAAGQSFVFNGTDSYVNVPSSDALKPSGPFTLEAWINYTGTPGSYSGYCIAAKGADAENAVDWALTVSANRRLRPHVNVNGGWYYYDCNTPLVSGVWYHVAMIYDGAHLQGYVNGALDGSVDVSGPVQTSDESLRIGAYAPVNGDGSKAFFAGRIDEVTHYNRSLSAEELLAIYNAGGNGKCPNAFGPVAMPDAFSTGTNTPVSFSARKLLLNDTDPHGFTLSVTGVSSNSALGGTVTLIAGRVHYTPPTGFWGNDQFSYSITNDHGDAAGGTVTATVGAGGPVGLNITFGPVVQGSEFVVRFAGIPGLTYTIEAASGLGGPWIKVANITAPTTNTGFGIGAFEFREPIGAFESRFYRTVYPSY